MSEDEMALFRGFDHESGEWVNGWQKGTPVDDKPPSWEGYIHIYDSDMGVGCDGNRVTVTQASPFTSPEAVRLFEGDIVERHAQSKFQERGEVKIGVFPMFYQVDREKILSAPVHGWYVQRSYDELSTGVLASADQIPLDGSWHKIGNVFQHPERLL